jgi:hypothetical protein
VNDEHGGPGVQTVPVSNRKEDAMEDFVGTWDVEETTFHGHRTLKDRPVLITIVKNGTQYDVTIPLQSGDKVFTESPYMTPMGQTISHTWTDVSGSIYGVRLVFDHTVNPAQIVEKPLCSVIERWGKRDQPTDMGTITGTRLP